MIINSIEVQVFPSKYHNLSAARKAKAVTQINFHGGGDRPVETLCQTVELLKKLKVNLHASANVSFVNGETMRFPSTHFDTLWPLIRSYGVEI